MPMLVLTNTPIYAVTLQSFSFRRPFFVARIGTLGEAWAIIFRRVFIWCLPQSLHNLQLYRVFHVFTGSKVAIYLCMFLKRRLCSRFRAQAASCARAWASRRGAVHVRMYSLNFERIFNIHLSISL